MIIDCWGNFDYFMVETGGETEKQSIPLPVRLFFTRLQKLTLALSLKKDSIIEDCITKLKEEIASLPQNNVVILDSRTKLDQIDVNYWSDLTKEKTEFLQKEIAPLMRTRSGEDYEAMYFELKVLLYSIAKIDEKQEKKLKENLLSRSAKIIIEMVSDLPLNVNVVAKQKDLINSVLTGGYLQKSGEVELNNLVEKLGPLMKLRDPVKQSQVSLDLQDVTHEKGYIKFGPEHERITVQKYRDRVQTLIKNLEKKNSVLRKIKMGESITDEELNQLAATLQENDPYPTEENLQKAYEARKVKFLDLIKYIMGVSGLVTFPQKVTAAFDGFIAQHNNLTTKQIQFIQTLQSFIIENGELSKKDLVSEPFTKFHNNGFLGLFDHQLQQEILQLTDRILNYA